MKKVKIKRTFSIALLLLFLLCGSSWAANFSFTDPEGQWGSAANFSITIDWSDDWAITAASWSTFYPGGTGNVNVALDTESPLVNQYSLDATVAGPEIAVTAITFFTPSSQIWANSSDTFFVAWGASSKTIMFYDGDPLGNCYTYLGLAFSDDLAWSPPVGTSITFTASSVEAIVGQQLCNAVPIPGAIWLLSSGLFGLFFIRRKDKI